MTSNQNDTFPSNNTRARCVLQHLKPRYSQTRGGETLLGAARGLTWTHVTNEKQTSPLKTGLSGVCRSELTCQREASASVVPPLTHTHTHPRWWSAVLLGASLTIPASRSHVTAQRAELSGPELNNWHLLLRTHQTQNQRPCVSLMCCWGEV